MKQRHNWSMLWSNMTYLDIREEVLEQVGARVACVEEHQLGFLQMVWGQTFLNVAPKPIALYASMAKNWRKRPVSNTLGPWFPQTVTPLPIIPDVWARIKVAWMKWRQVTGILCDKKIPDHKGKGMFDSWAPSCSLWSKMLAHDQVTWASHPCDGNEDTPHNEQWYQVKTCHNHSKVDRSPS